MAIFAAVAFATFFLENDHFVTLYEGSSYFANNFCAFHCGSAYFYLAINVGEKHAVELYGLTFLNFFTKVMNIQEAVLFCLELLALNFYDNVHY